MWCQYEHKASAKSFFLGIYQGTSWLPRPVRLNGMFSQQNGVRTARSHAVRSPAFVLTQEIHTAGVVYISEETVRNKLFNRRAPRFVFFFWGYFFSSPQSGPEKLATNSALPTQSSSARFASCQTFATQQLMTHKPSQLLAVVFIITAPNCIRPYLHTQCFFFSFNGFTVKVRRPQPLLLRVLPESKLNGEAKLTRPNLK